LAGCVVIVISLHFVSFSLRQKSFLRQKVKQWENLGTKIDAVIKKFDGKAGVVIVDLENGWKIERNEDIKFPAASLIKLPIGMVVYKAIAEGKIKEHDVIEIKKSDIVLGSGVIRKRGFPQSYRIDQLLALMLTVSDNTACNKIIKLLGFDYINDEMEKFGLKDTTLKRLMMDFKARKRGIENYTTARDMARVWEVLYFGEVLGEKTSNQLIELLKNQKVRDRIPKLLTDRVAVANKTGLERNVCHDSGISFTLNHEGLGCTPGGDILVVVLTSDFKTFNSAKKFISQIAFLSYNYILQVSHERKRYFYNSECSRSK
jgi:beta-lactamase class A